MAGGWLSGRIIYSRYDGRWGRLPFTPAGDWIDRHGTVGFLLLPLALAFAAYSLSLGRARLRRAGNALALAALALAVTTGKLMNEDWLRDGALHHLAYGLHLLAWLLLALAVLLHVAASLRRGGMPLLATMASTAVRPGDRPGDWPAQVRRFLQRTP